jgi:hypothetical protein
MATVEANGVTVGVERFGDAAAPLVLLAGGTTMLSWPDALCAGARASRTPPAMGATSALAATRAAMPAELAGGVTIVAHRAHHGFPPAGPKMVLR